MRLDEVMERTGSLSLEDPPDSPLGEIGVLIETRAGDLLVADRLVPRIRLFGQDGGLRAEAGAAGEGPFEFRRVAGLLEDPEGRLIALDPGIGRATIYSGTLQGDTALQVRPSPRGPGVALADGRFLVLTAPGSRTSELAIFSSEWTLEVGFPSPSAPPPWEKPYWSSIGGTLVASGSEAVATAYSLLYPIQLYSPDGDTLGIIQAPVGFRTVPEVEAGAFGGSAGSERLGNWLSSFDIIARMDVIQDSVLAVTRGNLSTSTRAVFDESHALLDLYSLPDGRIISEGIRLTPGTRVLAGGRGLLVLIDSPPGPWRIARFELWPEDQ